MTKVAHRVCSIADCGGAHVGKGYCNRHYRQFVRSQKVPTRMHSCAWCGESKPINEMRHPSSSRGKTPSTCHSCRESHPDEAWCDFHGQPHLRSAFSPRPSRPIGVDNLCVAAMSAKASMKLNRPPVLCPSCDTTKQSIDFRGGSVKTTTCRDCEAANPGQRWCLGCLTWIPEQLFTRTGRGGKYAAARCVPCRTAHAHGVTVEWILRKQGVESPECAACGSIDNLKIDHDHRCCPSSSGCPQCVRGYLCHPCNTSEGLLQTPERARRLLAYMERIAGS